MQCYLCNTDNEAVKFFDDVPYYVCSTCGLGYIPEFGNEAEYLKNYRLHHQAIDIQGANEKRSKQYRIDAQKLLRFKDSGSVLDIGCSTGAFLRELKDLGQFSLLKGIDLDDSAITRARALHPGIEFKQTDIESFDESDPFDLIVFRGVFQYQSHELVQNLEKLGRLLKPDGVLAVLSWPHSDSVVFNLLGSKWSLYEPMEHKLFGNSSTAHYIANRFGFEIIDLEFPYEKTVYASPAEDLKAVNGLISGEQTERSPAFYGNIIEVVLKKVSDRR